jgi:hypothetical protein
MSQRLNTEFNYRYITEGESLWAKIRNLKGFLEGRKRAEALEAINAKRHQSKKLKFEWLRKQNREWEALELEADIEEAESTIESAKEAYALNKKEIITLEKLLSELYGQAEPTRLKHADGKPYDDDDMFEANAEKEYIVWLAKEIQADIIATGRPSQAHARHALASPNTLKALQGAGLILEAPEILQAFKQFATIASSLKMISGDGETDDLTIKVANDKSIQA